MLTGTAISDGDGRREQRAVDERQGAELVRAAPSVSDVKKSGPIEREGRPRLAWSS